MLLVILKKIIGTILSYPNSRKKSQIPVLVRYLRDKLSAQKSLAHHRNLFG